MSLMVTYLLRFMANKIGFYNPEVGKKILHNAKVTYNSYFTILWSAINDIKDLKNESSSVISVYP